VPDRRLLTVICVPVLAAVVLAGCGGGATDAQQTAAQSAAPAGCGRFCQQAGPLQAGGRECSTAACGRSDCPAYGCPPCPAPGSLASQRGCVDVLTQVAHVADGTVPVTARCRWRIRCVGALVLFRDPGRLAPEGRIGAADLLVPSGRSQTVRVALTSGGRAALRGGDGLRVAAVVVLKWAQGAPDTSQTLRIAR
jgi:hypothetical protein